MNHTKIQKNIFSKTISLFILLGFFLSAMTPYIVIAQTVSTQVIPLESLIAIPQVDTGTAIIPDISQIDWNQTVTIGGKTKTLNSDEVLSVLAIPSDIKDLIKSYRSDRSSLDKTIFMWPSTKVEKREQANDGLKFSIAKKLVDKGQLPKNYLDLDAQGFIEPTNIIDVKNTQLLNSDKATTFEQSSIRVLDMETVTISNKKEPSNIIERVENVIKDVVNKVVSYLTPESALADVATVTEDGIDYLLSEQNIDGSWGSGSTQFITTVAVVDALLENNVTGTEVSNGIAWISSYITSNNDYLAQQIKILAKAGEDTENLQSLANQIDETTGGFRYNLSLKADPLTTARVIQALTAANYEDAAPKTTATEAMALHYLIDTQRFDNGWSVFESGVSSIPSTTEVIEALLLWRHRTLGSGSVEIDDTLDPAVSSLTSTQLSNGTWENNTINTALAYHAIKASGQVPTYQLDTIEYFENEQDTNGSFNNDIYTTAKVIKALSISTESGQLTITDLVPLTTLRTGTLAQIRVVLTNTGNTAVDSGLLHFIADDYHVASIDFESNNIVVNANSSLNLTLEISSTRSYQGNVVFKVFIEGTNEVIHPNSRYEESLTFLADTANRPATPMYYVAYKGTSGTSTPAITWRWPVKSDPNLYRYILMLRKLGVTTWSTVAVSTTTSSATISGLLEGEIYEATMGTSNTGGSIYYWTPPVQVKVSATASNYIGGTASGTVKSVDGIIKGVSILGVTTGSGTTSNEDDGTYTQSNVPWGSGYARVSNFLYENYVKKYTTANTSVTGINVYTNLKPDTANPTVTNVSIVGESDKIMENKETELIQYTVGDDIGTSPGIVKSATFYYYEPSDTTWHLIGSEEGFLTGTRTYAWNIPGNLLGSGYKIKVIARDFAGKDSTATEWGGTFELTAGNESPTFMLTAPTSAVVTSADASYTIKWNDEDIEDNASITLYYDADNNPDNSNHISIVTVNEDDPTDQYVWDTSGISASSKYIRADITDGHNGTLTVYSEIPVTISH